MNYIYTIIFMILAHQTAFATDPDERDSLVSATAQYGNQSYQDYDLAGKIGLGHIMRFDFDGSQNSSTGSGISKALELGIDGMATPSLDITINYIGTSDPNNLKSNGFAPGADWTVSDLWQSERETILSIAFQSLQYSQSTIPADRTKLLTAKFRQNAFSFGADQDLTESLSAKASFTSDSYNSLNAAAVALLGKNSAKTRSVNTKLASSSFQGLTDGLPSRSYTLGLNFKFSDIWSAEGKYTHTRLAITNVLSDEEELIANYNASKAWSFALALAYSKEQYEQGITALGPTVSYNF